MIRVFTETQPVSEMLMPIPIPLSQVAVANGACDLITDVMFYDTEARWSSVQLSLCRTMDGERPFAGDVFDGEQVHGLHLPIWREPEREPTVYVMLYLYDLECQGDDELTVTICVQQSDTGR